jgi:hypothetical protein
VNSELDFQDVLASRLRSPRETNRVCLQYALQRVSTGARALIPALFHSVSTTDQGRIASELKQRLHREQLPYVKLEARWQSCLGLDGPDFFSDSWRLVGRITLDRARRLSEDVVGADGFFYQGPETAKQTVWVPRSGSLHPVGSFDPDRIAEHLSSTRQPDSCFSCFICHADTLAGAMLEHAFLRNHGLVQLFPSSPLARPH